MLKRLLIPFVVILIFLLSLFTFRDIFGYGLCCDDNLAIFNSLAYGLRLSSLFSPYGGQVWGAKILYSIFGLGPQQYYFITLFVLRLLTAVSVYFLGLAFSKNKWMALFSSTLFLIGFAGVGVAEYAHLANIFIGLSLLNVALILFVYFYINSKAKEKRQSPFLFVLISLVFAISIAVATVRVNATIFYYLIMELGLVILKLSKVKSAVQRIFIFSLFILLLRRLGSFGGSSPYHLSMIKMGLATTFSSLTSLVKAFYYNVSIYFDILSPPILDKAILTFLNQLNFLKLINNNVIFIFLAFVFIVVDILLAKKTKKKALFFAHLVLWIIYLLGFKWAFGDIYSSYEGSVLPIETTSYLFHAMNAFFSGLFVFFVIDVILTLSINKQKMLAFKTFLLFIWPMVFMFVTYFFSPRTFYFETFLSYPVKFQESYVHYYFVPSLGIYFLISYLAFNIIPVKKYTRAGILILTLLIFANISSVRTWIGGRAAFRSASVLENVFQTINSEIKHSYEANRMPIVYFTSIDDGAVFFPYAVSEWGFGQFKYPLKNKLYAIVPYFTSGTLEELMAIIGSKKFASDHGLGSVVKLEDVYAFRVEERKVYSETTKVRQLLGKRLFLPTTSGYLYGQ